MGMVIVGIGVQFQGKALAHDLGARGDVGPAGVGEGHAIYSFRPQVLHGHDPRTVRAVRAEGKNDGRVVAGMIGTDGVPPVPIGVGRIIGTQQVQDLAQSLFQ